MFYIFIYINQDIYNPVIKFKHFFKFLMNLPIIKIVYAILTCNLEIF